MDLTQKNGKAMDQNSVSFFYLSYYVNVEKNDSTGTVGPYLLPPSASGGFMNDN